MRRLSQLGGDEREENERELDWQQRKRPLKMKSHPVLWRRDVAGGQSATPRSSALRNASRAGNMILQGVFLIIHSIGRGGRSKC